MSTITACVVARDEAANLAELLPTLRWADEVLVVVDDATQDDSREIAAAIADRVETRGFVSFSALRNAALDLAAGDWVFFVDADERVSPALADETRAAVAGAAAVDDAHARRNVEPKPASVGFWVPRLNVMFGRLILGGGWYPDEQLRLLRRDVARYDESLLVHERAEVTGPTGHLQEPLLHLNYRSFRQFFRKQRRYTELEAQSMIQQGDHPRRRALIGAPLREFGRRYFTHRGWGDGPVGLFLSLAMAYFAYRRVRLVRAGVT